MTFVSKTVKTILVVSITLLGAIALSCGGDDDDDLVAGSGGNTDYSGSAGTTINTGANGGTAISTGRAGASGRSANTTSRDAGSNCGCVDSSGQCHRGITTNNCGANGGQCVACGSGQTCSAGACVAGSSDAGRRVNTDAGCGCVDSAGACHRGISTRNCGANGGQCVRCGSGQSCSAGACVYEDAGN